MFGVFCLFVCFLFISDMLIVKQEVKMALTDQISSKNKWLL